MWLMAPLLTTASLKAGALKIEEGIFVLSVLRMMLTSNMSLFSIMPFPCINGLKFLSKASTSRSVVKPNLPWLIPRTLTPVEATCLAIPSKVPSPPKTIAKSMESLRVLIVSIFTLVSKITWLSFIEHDFAVDFSI